MSGILDALDAALVLTTLSQRLLEAAGQVNALIAQAQAENRDLTADELATIHARRQAALDRLDSLP
jgi:hypothetical protein